MNSSTPPRQGDQPHQPRESDHDWINVCPDSGSSQCASSQLESEAQRANRLNRLQHHAVPIQLAHLHPPDLWDLDIRNKFLTKVGTTNKIDNTHLGSPDNIDPSELICSYSPIPGEIMENPKLMDLFHIDYTKPPEVLRLGSKPDLKVPEIEKFSDMFYCIARLRKDLIEYRKAGEGITRHSLIIRRILFEKDCTEGKLKPSLQAVVDKLIKFFISSPTKKAVNYVMEHQKYKYSARRRTMATPIHAMVNFLEQFLSALQLTKIVGKEIQCAQTAKKNAETILRKIEREVKKWDRKSYVQIVLESELEFLGSVYLKILKTCPLVQEMVWYRNNYKPTVESFGDNSVGPLIMHFNQLFEDLWQSEANPNGPRRLGPLNPGCKIWQLDHKASVASIREICVMIKIGPDYNPRKAAEKKRIPPEPAGALKRKHAELTPQATSSNKKRSANPDGPRPNVKG
ncbi:hypothetical protein TWF730_002970 [Orbilia blumenaviensis]|uniref:Uncharacterized protein n=1 Tax=Orbilia blumenaviensis TaxID=1796055 RepID=A0AAV9U7P2_9PEZI